MLTNETNKTDTPFRIATLGTARPWRSDATRHVVLLVDQFPAVLGGGERVVLRTARLLGQAGYAVSIVTFQILCDAEMLRTAQCPVYLLPIQNVLSFAGVLGAWRYGVFLRRMRVQIVMTFFESSNLFGGLATKALSRSRLIWNRRDMGILREPKHKAAYRNLRWLPDHVIAVSEEVKRHAIDEDRIQPGRVSVIYNGLEKTPLSEPHPRSSRPSIVTVGNLRPVKGHDILIEAASMVLSQHPEVQFKIAGEPLEAEYFASLRLRVDQLGIEKSFDFLGGVLDTRPLLDAASIFVLPSRSEGFSNAIVEAMLAGLPVVATTVGGNAEAVIQGETGLLVPPERPDLLADALTFLLSSPERMRSMGEAGRVRAERLFSAEGMVRRLERVFEMVLSTR